MDPIGLRICKPHIFTKFHGSRSQCVFFLGGVLLFWILLGSTFYLTPGGMYSFPTWPGSYDGTSDLTFAIIITGAFGTDDSLKNLFPQGEPPGILFFYQKFGIKYQTLQKGLQDT